MRINTRLRQRESDLQKQLGVLAARGSMAAMIDPADPAASWQAMTVAEKRAALRKLFEVTVNKTTQRGRVAGGGYFDSGRITVTPLT
jgi:phage-related baseplate assembly protein